MNRLEEMRGEDIGLVETGGAYQEEESYFDETLDKAVDGLKKKGFLRIPDVINRLDKNKKATKEKLASVLNVGGYDWRIFDTLVKSAENEKAVSDMIVTWAEETEYSADDAARLTANAALVQELDSF